MDIFNFARAAEQAIYETVSWLYFYPATLLRVLFRPVTMMDYAGAQTEVEGKTAFSGAMQPALLLLISIILGASLVPLEAVESQLLPAAFRDSWLHLIALRSVMFGIFPMVGSIICDLFTPGEVTRETLKKPFNQQAYIYAPFALIVSPALILTNRDEVAPALTAIGLMTVWVIAVQVAFFRRTIGFGTAASVAAAFGTVLIGFVLNLALITAVEHM